MEGRITVNMGSKNELKPNSSAPAVWSERFAALGAEPAFHKGEEVRRGGRAAAGVEEADL
jgi:hypothetical protein